MLIDGYPRTDKQKGTESFETYFPTQSKAQSQDAWLPCENADPGRPKHAEAPSPKRTPPFDSMKGSQPSQSFPKSLRLLRRPDFRKVYEEGRRRSVRICTIFFRSNGLAITRLGITTPAGVGGSVIRNRIRRRLREVYRLNQAQIPPGWDVVVNPRPAVATMPMAALTREFIRLFPTEPAVTSSEAASRLESA